MTDNNGPTNNNNFNNLNTDSSKYVMDNSVGSYYPNQQQYNQFNSQPNNQFPVPNGQNSYINSQMFSNQNNTNSNDNMTSTQSINQNRSVYDMNINKHPSYPQQSPTPNPANNMNNYPQNMNVPLNNTNSIQQQQQQQQHSQMYSNMSFVFSSEMANKAICDINEKKYDNFKTWHISNYGHPNQFGNDKKIEQNCNRGVKRKMSPIKEQSNTFTKPLPIPTTNGIHGQESNSNHPQSNNYGNIPPSSRTYNKDDDNPLRRMERMTQETLNEPPSKISIRNNNNSINGDNNLSYDQKKSQEKHLKLEKLNQIEKVFGIDKTRQREESYHMNHMMHEHDINKISQGPINNPNGFMQGVPMNIQQGMHQNIRQPGPPNLGPPYLPNSNMPPPNRPGSQPMPGNQRQHPPQQQSPSVPFFPPGQNMSNRINQFPNQQHPTTTPSNHMMPSPQMYPMGSSGQQNKQFISPSSIPQQNNMRQMAMNGMQQPNMPPNINQTMNPNMTQMRQQNLPSNINPNINQINMPNGIPNHPLQQKLPVPNNMNVMNGQNNRPQNIQNPSMQMPGIQGPGLQSPNLQNSGMQGSGIPQQNMPHPNMQGNMQLPNSMNSIQKSQQQQNMDQMMIQQNQNNQGYLPNQQIPNQIINGQNGMVPQGNGQSNMMRPNYDTSMIPSF